MRAAINLEAALALLVILATLLRLPGVQRSESADRPKWLLLFVVIPAALFWTPIIPLLSDDFGHIGLGLRTTPSQFLSLFIVPESNGFFRPLGYISFALDGLWAGYNAALWHVSALLLHFANCLLLYVVARQLGLKRAFAATAVVIFGIHGSRPEAVTWIAGRFDLIATLFVLSTLSLFLRGRYTAALATAFLALISKESAYVLPVLLLLVTDRPQWRKAAPFAVLTAGVFLYRWHVLSGIGGYQTAGHTPTILNFSLVRTANALLLRLWATLFFPINWTQMPQWWLWGALALGLGGYTTLLLSGGRQRRTLAFLLFAFVAALPVQHLLLIGPDLEKSRVLYLPSIGFALFVAAVLETLRKPSWGIPAALGIMAFQIACLEHNLLVWNGVAQTARRACDAVAASLDGNNKSVVVLDLPSVLHGVYFLHKGMPDCLAVWHGVEDGRVREETADLVFHWDPQSETVKR